MKRAATIRAICTEGAPQSLASADLKAAQAQKVAAETDGARVDSMINAADAIQRVAVPPSQIELMASPSEMPMIPGA